MLPQIKAQSPRASIGSIAVMLLIQALVPTNPSAARAETRVENDDDAEAGSAVPLVCAPHPTLGTRDPSRRPPAGSRLCTGFLMSQLPGDRSHTFDAALDVSLAVPPGRGPFPLLVSLHGFLGSKADNYLDLLGNKTEGGDDFTTLNEGIAPLRFSARGRGSSYGDTQLSDEDFEVRDIQNLVRQVVEGSAFAAPPPFSLNRKKIAATGLSSGGAQALLLAQTGWRSWPCRPDTCELVAAIPVATWADLAYSLVPNGLPFTPYDQPGYVLGIEKFSYVNAFFFGGMRTDPRYGGSNFPPYLYRYYALVAAGEPYQDPQTKAFLPQIRATAEELLRTFALDRSPAYQDYCSSGPIPILMIQGWTDDMFTAQEVLRLRNVLDRQCGHEYPLKIYMGNSGHPRARLTDDDELAHSQELITDWLRYYLLDEGPRPSFDVTSGVSAPGGAAFDPSAVFTVRELEDMQRGRILGTLTGDFTVSNSTGTPRLSDLRGDPVADAFGIGRADSFAAFADSLMKDVDPLPGQGAVYSVATDEIVAEGAPYLTVCGPGAVGFTGRVVGTDVSYIARVFDVGPDGSRYLIDRGELRFLGRPGTHTVTVPLHGNVWRLEPGRTLVVQISNSDFPYLRPNNLPSSTLIRRATVDLPTCEEGTVGFTTATQSPDQTPSAVLGRLPERPPPPGGGFRDELVSRLPHLPRPALPFLH